MKKKLVVYLLSYNRPEFIRETVESFLQQQDLEFDLVISENSPNHSIIQSVLEPYLSRDYSIRLFPRTPSLPALEHFNAILNEVRNYEYAMLFHDDDVLKSDYALSKMVAQLEESPDATAISCNAYILKDTLKTNLLLSPSIRRNLRINTQTQLINRYLFRFLSHPPFPAYIYRTSFLDDCYLNTADGGKYSDLSFLSKLIKKGPFIWLAEPLLYYRQHNHNDSAHLSLREITSLCLFLAKTCPWTAPQIFFYFCKQVFKYLFFSAKRRKR